jgi:FkbM family methyltransferase
MMGAMTDTSEDLVARHGRSDRTAVLRVARRLPLHHAARLTPLMQRGGVCVLAGAAQGLWFPARAVQPGHAHAQLILSGELEIPVQEALRRSIPLGGTVYDVGANIGYFALLAARFAGDGGRVIAFEPVPAIAELVREAAQRSSLAERVEVRAQAVALTAGTEALYVVADGSWSHLASRGNPGDLVDTIDVPVVTLDDVVAGGAPPPDVIKLDVEGSEGDVLRGATEVLRAHRPVIVLELHDTHEEALPVLREAGYVFEALDGPWPAEDPRCKYLVARPDCRDRPRRTRPRAPDRHRIPMPILPSTPLPRRAPDRHRIPTPIPRSPTGGHRVTARTPPVDVTLISVAEATETHVKS